MKRFLQENPHFIDVLRTAAKAAESNGNDYVAGTVQRFADELEAFDKATGKHDTEHKDRSIFRLDCGFPRSCWKAWQRKAFQTAKQYEDMLFTYDTITALVAELQAAANTAKNHGEVRNPDWAFCREYGVNPCVTIGEGCTITFEPVRGYYLMKEVEPEKPRTCKSCGFYENGCPVILGKFIPYPSMICNCYTEKEVEP